MYDNEQFDPETAIVLAAGSVEYDAAAAAIPIDELIAALEEAREGGAQAVLMSSGNYRGAQWQRLSADWITLTES